MKKIFTVLVMVMMSITMLSQEYFPDGYIFPYDVKEGTKFLVVHSWCCGDSVIYASMENVNGHIFTQLHITNDFKHKLLPTYFYQKDEYSFHSYPHTEATKEATKVFRGWLELCDSISGDTNFDCISNNNLELAVDLWNENALKNLNEHNQKTAPYGRYDFEWEKNSVDGVDITFKYVNYNKKTIKYIDFWYSLSNDVDDKCSIYLGSNHGRCVGPLEYGYNGEWSFDALGYTSGDATYLKITKIIITYTNGTKITLIKDMKRME